MSSSGDKKKKSSGSASAAAAAEAKKKKEEEAARKEAYILSLSKTEQVEQLSQALLREYMHKRGFKKTLSKFDEECPRSDKTIASRQMMETMMALGVVTGRNKNCQEALQHLMSSTGDGAGANLTAARAASLPTTPVATFMEMLCSYRLRKRQIATVNQQAEANFPRGEAPASQGEDEEGNLPAATAAAEAAATEAQRQLEMSKQIHSSLGYDSSGDEGYVTASQAARRKEIERMKAAADEAVANAAKSKEKKKKDKKDKKAKPGDDIEGDSEEKKSKKDKKNKKEKKEKKAATKKQTMDPLLEAAMGTVAALPGSGLGAPAGSNARGGVGRNWTPGASGAPSNGDAGDDASLDTAASSSGSSWLKSTANNDDFDPMGVAQFKHLREGAGDYKDTASPISNSSTSSMWKASANSKPSSAPEGSGSSSSSLTRTNSGGKMFAGAGYNSTGSGSGDSPVASPYKNLGTAVYDPNAKAAGVLSKATPSSGGKPPTFAPSTGGGSSGGGGVSFAASASSSTSSISSPTSKRTGISFTNSPNNNSPNSGSRSSRRKVTIVE